MRKVSRWRIKRLFKVALGVLVHEVEELHDDGSLAFLFGQYEVFSPRSHRTRGRSRPWPTAGARRRTRAAGRPTEGRRSQLRRKRSRICPTASGECDWANTRDRTCACTGCLTRKAAFEPPGQVLCQSVSERSPVLRPLFSRLIEVDDAVPDEPMRGGHCGIHRAAGRLLGPGDDGGKRLLHPHRLCLVLRLGAPDQDICYPIETKKLGIRGGWDLSRFQRAADPTDLPHSVDRRAGRPTALRVQVISGRSCRPACGGDCLWRFASGDRRRRGGAASYPTPHSGRQPAWSVIQQTVPHGPDHDLLLRAKTKLALDAVEGVPDGHRLDSPGLRNRVV